MINVNYMAALMICIAFIVQAFQLYRFFTKKAVNLFIFIYPVIFNYVMLTLVFNNINKSIIDVASFKVLISIIIIEGFMNTNIQSKLTRN